MARKSRSYSGRKRSSSRRSGYSRKRSYSGRRTSGGMRGSRAQTVRIVIQQPQAMPVIGAEGLAMGLTQQPTAPRKSTF